MTSSSADPHPTPDHPDEGPPTRPSEDPNMTPPPTPNR